MKHQGPLEIFAMAGAWMYVSIPLAKVPKVKPGGWGSIPVGATVGSSTWETSLFPIKKDHYFIPIKKAVAKKEKLRVGDPVSVSYVVRERIKKVH